MLCTLGFLRCVVDAIRADDAAEPPPWPDEWLSSTAGAHAAADMEFFRRMPRVAVPACSDDLDRNRTAPGTAATPATAAHAAQ